MMVFVPLILFENTLEKAKGAALLTQLLKFGGPCWT